MVSLIRSALPYGNHELIAEVLARASNDEADDVVKRVLRNLCTPNADGDESDEVLCVSIAYPVDPRSCLGSRSRGPVVCPPGIRI